MHDYIYHYGSKLLNYYNFIVLENDRVTGVDLHVTAVFGLVVDKHVVCSSTTNLLTAVALMFGSYFIFNIGYPTEACATLEFIQRYEVVLATFQLLCQVFSSIRSSPQIT